MASLEHVAGSLAADEKPGITGQFPGLEEQFFGGLQHRFFDVGACVEEADFDRSDGFLDIGEQILNLSLLAGIDAEGMDLAAFRPEFINQGNGFRGVASCNADLVASMRKAAGNSRTDRIAGADQQHNFIARRHLDHLPAITGHEAALTTLSAIILSMAASAQPR